MMIYTDNKAFWNVLFNYNKYGDLFHMKLEHIIKVRKERGKPYEE